MVLLSTQEPTTTYEIFDDRGNAMGRVVLPRDPVVVGIGRGTVYLDRGHRLETPGRTEGQH